MTTKPKFFRRRNRSAPADTNPRGAATGGAAGGGGANNNVASAIPIRSIQIPSNASTAPLTCHTCREPIPRTTRHIHTSRTLSGERRYHRPCFICLHCNAPIDPQSQSFCYAKLNKDVIEGSNHHGSGHDQPYDNDEHPFHRECFARHFGWMCVVCEKPLPMVTKFNDIPLEENYENNNTATAANNNTNGHNNNAAASGGAGQGGQAAAGQPGATSTKVEFLKHPFFDNERMCPHHAGPTAPTASNTTTTTTPGQQNNSNGEDPLLGGGHNNNNNNNNSGVRDENVGGSGGRGSVNTTTSEAVMGEIRRCAGCHRFEPLFASSAKHFIDVGDSNTGRCVCLACCRTVVTTSDDVIPLWDKVIDFFEGPLGLITSEDSATDTIRSSSYNNKKVGVTRRDLKNIPIMIVGHEALNDNMRRGSIHFGSNQIMTRGLCLSEHTRHGPDCGIGVTAILCLSGLPSDLTASILAHEAAHAWIKLHPNFPYTDPLPLKVEEGLCQLVAFLFLNDGLDPIELSSHLSSDGDEEADDSIPSDEKLRQYFRFCIETDEGVYGEGFRLAARAYAKMGMQELLYYVALHHDFPPL